MRTVSRPGLSIAALAAGLCLSGAARADDCDRACLVDLTDRVLAAIADGGPASLPLGQRVRYTENGQELPLGDGLWGTLTGYAGDGPSPLTYRLDVVDPETGEAAVLRAIEENGNPALLALRLNGRASIVNEIEAIVVREEGFGAGGGTVTLFQPRLLAAMDASAFTTPDRALTSGVSAAASEAELVAVAEGYFDAIASGRSGAVSFAPGCVRRDNGVAVTNADGAQPLDPDVPAYRPFALGCAEQIDSGFFSNVGEIRGRRYVVEPELGLVYAIVAVDHPAEVKSFEAPGYGTIDYPGPKFAPDGFDLELFRTMGGPNMIVPTTDLVVSVLKIENGLVSRVESVTRGGPYGMRTGWEE